MFGKHIGLIFCVLLISTAFGPPARATLVTFDITGFSFGSGHGVPFNESSNLTFGRSGALSLSIRKLNSDLPMSGISTFLSGKLTLEEGGAGDRDISDDLTITSSGGRTYKLTAFGTNKSNSKWNDWTDHTPSLTLGTLPFGKSGTFVISLYDRSSKGGGWRDFYGTITPCKPGKKIPVPEPGTLALMAGGLVIMRFLRRRACPISAGTGA